MARLGPARATLLAALVILGALAGQVPASEAGVGQLWLSPRGNDGASGASAHPLRSLAAAWRRIPRGVSGDWVVHLADGDYRANAPTWWDGRSGRLTLRGSGSSRKALIPEMNVYGLNGLRVERLTITGGEPFHCERCTNVTLSALTLRGHGQETIKFNQSSHVTVQGSDVSGAWDNAFDAVAVGHLRLIGNHFHGAADWCAYAKGGSHDVIVRGNLFSNCGTGGFTAGQGTGLQFMTWPFVHHEARDVLIEDNSVRSVEGAAFGVNGAANVLIRRNLAYRVGARSHVLEVSYGGRSCDGQPGDPGREACGELISRGAWGTAAIDDGDNFVRIPNRHVLIYDNVILNPTGAASRWQVFEVPGPPGSRWEASIPFTPRADSGLRIVGNVIWDGGPTHSLGLGESACVAGSGCSPATVLASNLINARKPSLGSLADGRLRRVGWLAALGRHQPPVPEPTVRQGAEPAPWTAWP